MRREPNVTDLSTGSWKGRRPQASVGELVEFLDFAGSPKSSTNFSSFLTSDLDAWSEGTWSIIGIVGGVCTLAITCFFISLHEERVRRANEAALLPSVPTPTPAQEVSIETLRTSLFQTVDVLLQRGGGTDSVEAVELSTVFEGEDEDESDEEEEDGHKRVRQGLLPRYEEVST